jgi:4-oxalocrotonate tautomerase
MPFIRITVIGPTLTLDQIHRLQEGTTDLMTGTMRKPIEGTSVLVEQIHQGGWSIARAQVPIAAQVEVTIGLGTNTPDEKARFMTEMMALLRTVLGREVREETYITIREYSHDSYGRGGLTRAERDQRRTAA